MVAHLIGRDGGEPGEERLTVSSVPDVSSIENRILSTADHAECVGRVCGKAFDERLVAGVING
jgi:hypothetical protein